MSADLDAREAAFLRELRLEQAAPPPAPWRPSEWSGRRRRAELAAALHLVDDYEPTGTTATPPAGGAAPAGPPGLRVVS